MQTPGEHQSGRRLALVVATGSYQDPKLAKLRAPGRDASDLADVLGDASIGGFQVETVLDAPADSLRRRVAQFCAQGAPRDVAMVYLSCHGVLDDRGRLYYATIDTDHELLSATAISAAWLNEQLEDCRCRRQIVVLDCCHSGAFAKGAKGESGLALRERFEGRGRVVLTASRATEYSFEGNRVVGDGLSSVFTGVLVEGLRSGDADRDRDGVVTVTELYDYAYEAVRASDARQTPTLWTYGAEGGLLIAHSPRGAVIEPAPLPEDLLHLLESARPRVREGAVAELADLLVGRDVGRALAAREHLERIAAEDIPQVAGTARRALGAEREPAAVEQGPRAASTQHEERAAQTGSRRAGHEQRLSPRGRAPLLIAGGLTAAIAATVVVALLSDSSPRSSASLAAISVTGEPRGIAVGEGAVWVAQHDAGKVSKIDAGSGRVVKSVDVRPRPDKVVADEGSVWVSINDGGGIARIDPTELKVTATQDVDARAEACDCPGPGLVIAEGELWVAAPRKGTITRRDVFTGKVAEPVLEPGGGFDGYFAVGGGAVWAVGRVENGASAAWLARIDPQDGEVDRYQLGEDAYPSGVAFGHGAVWIADAANSHNDVIRFDPDPEDKTPIRVDSGVSGDDIAVAGDAVLVWEPGGGILTRIDVRTNKAVETRRASRYGTGQTLNTLRSELDAADGLAWVTEPAGNLVKRLAY